jgi:DNA-directed RNA polymerase
MPQTLRGKNIRCVLSLSTLKQIEGYSLQLQVDSERKGFESATTCKNFDREKWEEMRLGICIPEKLVSCLSERLWTAAK